MRNELEKRNDKESGDVGRRRDPEDSHKIVIISDIHGNWRWREQIFFLSGIRTCSSLFAKENS